VRRVFAQIGSNALIQASWLREDFSIGPSDVGFARRVALFLPDRQYTAVYPCFFSRRGALATRLAGQAMNLKRRSDKPAFELMEEAVHLLRQAPAGVLATYYLGTLPFILALLFFWADMSRNAFAPRMLVGGALGLAVLFVWMKTWQAVFARQLRALASNRAVPSITFRRWTQILITQCVLQPFGLFLLPLALLVFLPFGWVYAFFQNATALDEGEEPGIGTLINKARRQATLWPRQNHVALLTMIGFAFFVFLNWCSLGLAIPELLKTLFGVESVFTRGSRGLLNTTFFAINFWLTYLCVDPILKAIYVLRCFYGESQESGEDLKAVIREYVQVAGDELAPLQTSGKSQARVSSAVTILMAAVILLLPNTGKSAQTEENSGPIVTVSTAEPQDLNNKLKEVLRQRKYTWRLPRENVKETETESALMGRVRKWLREKRDAFIEWLRKLFARRGRARQTHGGSDWVFFIHLLLYTLVALAIGALLWLLYHVLKTRRNTVVATAEAIQPAPDVADESVGAERLPEDGWMKLGRELLARGDLRLAMRAFYLASLAHLAAKNLVTLAKFKSNRDYERELRRRGHALPELPPLFSENVSAFDRTWYGMHEVTEDLVNHFILRVERLRGRNEIAMNKPS
jgi:hypothetical protein